MTPLYSSADELNSKTELFCDPERPEHENGGPFVVVRDDFYPNPMEIRRIALKQEFYQYSPPLPEQIGEDIGSNDTDLQPAWVSSSLLRHFGRTVANPKPGYRHAPPEVRQAIADLIGEDVTAETWDEMGDWWNGAFHVQYETWRRGSIHHHYKERDVAIRGWSGLVYLAPDAPAEVGTTIWREKATGRCIASKGARFDRDAEKFDLALVVENRFNRLVLFRENVLHRAEHGFGTTPESGKLTQTFFFHSERNS